MTSDEIRSCEEALQLLAAYLDEELDTSGQEQVKRHLDTCRSCYSRGEFERRLRERIAELGREEIRPALADRVHTLVRTFTVAGGG